MSRLVPVMLLPGEGLKAGGLNRTAQAAKEGEYERGCPPLTIAVREAFPGFFFFKSVPRMHFKPF